MILFSSLLSSLEHELAGLEHGEVVLRVHVRDGKPWRATISREASLLLETDATCVGPDGGQRTCAAKGGRNE